MMENSKKTKWVKKLMIGCLVMSLAFMPTLETYASAGSNMAKVLKYYKKGDLKKAKKYNKKLKKVASEKCVKKMSKKMKAAYRKVVTGYRLESDLGKSYLWGYYLTDIDNDKKAELLVQFGTCEADARTRIYKYKKGKAVKLLTVSSGHTSYHAYPGHKGIVSSWQHMGYQDVSVIYVKGGELKAKGYGNREGNQTLELRYVLNSHIKYDRYYNRSLDLRDLQ